MADRSQMPAPPKDCVYGPWWDGVISRWLAITPTPSGAPHYWAHQWTGSDWCPYSSSERELLRLAKENAELRAEFLRFFRLIEGYAEMGRLDEGTVKSVGYQSHCDAAMHVLGLEIETRK